MSYQISKLWLNEKSPQEMSMKMSSYDRLEMEDKFNKRMKCPECDKVLLTMSAFVNHIRTHDRVHQCKLCHKRFARKRRLNVHNKQVHNLL